MSSFNKLIVTCPFFCEDLIVAELERTGHTGINIHHGAVSARGTLESAYRTCIWSRFANRVLVKLYDLTATGKDDLAQALVELDFQRHFSVTDTFAVESRLRHTFLSNPGYASLLVKDAVADSFRKRSGRRPNVDTENPDIRLHFFLEGNNGELFIELNSAGLYKRSYRKKGGEAPLKENAAAAMLARAGWQEIARTGGGFVDCMCGSGTLPVEALLMAADIAPGAFRRTHGPEKWKGHDRALWDRLMKQAVTHKDAALANPLPVIIGYDNDREAVNNACENIRAAGLQGAIKIEQADFHNVKAPERAALSGLVVANPPYGRRLGADDDLKRFYSDLGQALSVNFPGWKAAILAGDRELARAVGLRAFKLHTLNNGKIRCTLAHFDLNAKNKFLPK